MKYTEEYLKIGLKFNHSCPNHPEDWPMEIVRYHNSGRKIVIRDTQGKEYSNYSKINAVSYLNSGTWIPVNINKKVELSYEIW